MIKMLPYGNVLTFDTGRIPRCNAVAPKGNGGLQCRAANLQRISGASPSPDTPMRPERP
jgi:hypothetical protein